MRPNCHTGYVESVALLSDGTRIISGSEYKCVRVWDVSMGAELTRLNSHSGPLCQSSFLVMEPASSLAWTIALSPHGTWRSAYVVG